MKKNVNVMSVILILESAYHRTEDANTRAEITEARKFLVTLFASRKVIQHPSRPRTTGVNLPANSFCPKAINAAAVSQ